MRRRTSGCSRHAPRAAEPRAVRRLSYLIFVERLNEQFSK
jgi:hypothetical protein